MNYCHVPKLCISEEQMRKIEDVLVKMTRNDLAIDITDMVIYLFSDFKDMRWRQILLL